MNVILCRLIFSVLLMLLCVHFFDFIFYRKFYINSRLYIDLRKETEKNCLESLELLAASYQHFYCKCLVKEIVIISGKESGMSLDNLITTMRLLNIKAQVIFDDTSFF